MLLIVDFTTVVWVSIICNMLVPDSSVFFIASCVLRIISTLSNGFEIKLYYFLKIEAKFFT